MLGFGLGSTLGILEGALEGTPLGLALGQATGLPEGVKVGPTLGWSDGVAVGVAPGLEVCCLVKQSHLTVKSNHLSDQTCPFVSLEAVYSRTKALTSDPCITLPSGPRPRNTTRAIPSSE